MPLCGKHEGKMYKCPQCLPSNGLLCEECYEKGGHSKHEGSDTKPEYHGWCDCGNHYYINREACCKDHPINNGGTCGNRRGKKFKCSCAKHNNAILCEHCSKHHGMGHTLTEHNSWWGTCDCGNRTYFDEKNWCKDHPGYALLTGRCWYKSGWLDQKGHGISAAWKASHKRWFQCRHNEIYYYTNQQWGYNWADPGCPKDDDEDAKGLNLHLPSLSLAFPSLALSLPSLSMPSMPSLSMPSMSMPSLSMPSLSAPSLSMPSIDMKAIDMKKFKPKTRQKDPLGYFKLEGTKVKKDGKNVVLSGVTYTRYFTESQTEDIKNASFTLVTPSEEQAESWYETLGYGGSTKA